MARQTRQQRRARREEGGGDDGVAAKPKAKPAAAEQSKLAQRARTRQQQVRPSAQAPKAQTGRRERPPRGRFIHFIRECWAELKKVDWPGRNQVTQATVVVIIACAIVGAYLYAVDLLFRNLVERII